MKPCWEVDTNGNIIEHYLWSDNEILEARVNGKTIVDFGWGEGFFTPKFDIIANCWIESISLDTVLTNVRETKIIELKALCQQVIYSGFTSTVTDSNGVFMEFGFNEHDQMNFNGRLNKINLWRSQLGKGEITQEQFDSNFPIQWKADNLGVVGLTQEQFFQVLDDAEKHQLNQQMKYWSLENQVNNATMIDEINSISWS